MSAYILFHSDSDGRFGGYCAWKYFKENYPATKLVMHEVQYGEPMPLDPALLNMCDEVYILDFSYDRATLESLNKRVGKLVVLDHHKKAEEQLRGLPYAKFDLTKSGALLAWEYFFPTQKAPMACLYVNDRDLWIWEFGQDTAAFEAFLKVDHVGTDWPVWDSLSKDEEVLKEAVKKGRGYLAYEYSVIASFVSNKKNFKAATLLTSECSMNATVYEGMGILTSEIAAKIYKDDKVDLTIEYRFRGDNISFSMRSKKVDVSEIAACWGGGGHASAGGFSVPVNIGLDIIRSLVIDKALMIPDTAQSISGGRINI